SEANIPASKKVTFILKSPNGISAHDAEVLRLLLKAEKLETDPSYEPPKGTPAVHSELGDLYLPLEGLLDLEAEKARLKKELEKAKTEIAKVEQKLANTQFVQKAPPQVLAEHQNRLTEWQAKKEHAMASLHALE